MSSGSSSDEFRELDDLDAKWDSANRVGVGYELWVSELEKLNPFRDDDAYEAELQSRRLRAELGTVNMANVRLITEGNQLLALAVIVMAGLTLLNPGGASVQAYVAILALGALPFIVDRISKDVSTYSRCVGKLTIATRVAAFGMAVRSPHNFILSRNDWESMRKEGSMKVFDADGTAYRVSAVFSLNDNTADLVKIYAIED